MVAKGGHQPPIFSRVSVLDCGNFVAADAAARIGEQWQRAVRARRRRPQAAEPAQAAPDMLSEIRR